MELFTNILLVEGKQSCGCRAARAVTHSAANLKYTSQMMSVRMKLKDVPAGTPIQFDSNDGKEQLNAKRKTHNISPIYTVHPLTRRKGAN